MRVEYHPAAADEFIAAIAHYNGLRTGLGDVLRAEVYAAIACILSNPHRFPLTRNQIRRCFVHRFPYSVLYRVIEPDLVRVLVVRHHRRESELGLTRR